jgi:hypothetical protein
MKRGFVFFICLSMVFAMFLIPGIIAPHENIEESVPTLYGSLTTESSPVTSIKLQAEGEKIEWETEGYSSSGFKVTWSKDENPVYPTRKNDRYHYHSSSDKTHDVLEAFDGKGEYYVRVCEYLGGKCGIYSNEVKVILGEGETEKVEVKEKDEYEEKYEYKEKDEDQICPAVCVPMWKIKEVKCVTAPCNPVCEYDECGSGCGVDGKKSFNTQEECDAAALKWKEEYEDKYEDKKYKVEKGESCNGCLVEEVCYPLGFRKKGTYCFDDFVFINQTVEGEYCDNNFECSSNLCLDNECISGGLIRKIMNWVKGIFGSD